MGFEKNFIWGAASAAYQIEGAYNEDGKGMGIWDALSEGRVKHGENGNIACDHYHRYKEDIAIMKKMGLKSYRFSISWPRIMPKEGVINQKGIEFYQNLVTELINAGIEPMCTIFHWNMPMWLHDKGGWRYEKISDVFAEYTEVIVKALSDKVSWWMTINEPACFIGNGYITGNHAPFENNVHNWDKIGEILPILCKNVLLSHGKAVQMIRKHAVKPPTIGIALNGNLVIPVENTKEEILIAKEATFSDSASFFGIDLWAGAMILGKLHPMLQGIINEEELRDIHQDLDFMGYNCYNANNYDEYTGVNKYVYPGMPRTAMDWPITPDALYWAVTFFYEKYKLPILITENGMANLDFVMTDGKIHDIQRIEYMKMYLKGLKRAAEEGIPIIGYLYWSIMDNFEWAEGYDKRFGLVYVDFRTQERIMKDSALWYAKLISENGESIGKEYGEI